MAFLAGIDEAGYGPFVGPFAVGFSLFRMPDVDLDLWTILANSCAPKPGRKDLRRLWLNDSKKVHQGPHGRARLERTVAAFRHIHHPQSSALDTWVTEAPAGPARLLHQAPWFQRLPGALCPTVSTDRARLDASALHQDLAATACSLSRFGARVVPAAEWNVLLQKLRGKGHLNFAITMEVVRHLLQLTEDAPLRIELDQQGGRRHYTDILQQALQPTSITIHGEGEGGSTYSLRFPSREVQIRFSQQADAHHLPVALASLAAKQSRERLMDLFNAWWHQKLPQLRPTKGYGVDGKRWLAEVLPQLDTIQVHKDYLKRRL